MIAHSPDHELLTMARQSVERGNQEFSMSHKHQDILSERIDFRLSIEEAEAVSAILKPFEAAYKSPQAKAFKKIQSAIERVKFAGNGVARMRCHPEEIAQREARGGLASVVNPQVNQAMALERPRPV